MTEEQITAVRRYEPAEAVERLNSDPATGRPTLSNRSFASIWVTQSSST
jgi:hypothetical protein